MRSVGGDCLGLQMEQSKRDPPIPDDGAREQGEGAARPIPDAASLAIINTPHQVHATCTPDGTNKRCALPFMFCTSCMLQTLRQTCMQVCKQGKELSPYGSMNKCPHGRQKSVCKECGGSGLCPHGRRKRLCKECDGRGSIVKENRVPDPPTRELEPRKTGGGGRSELTQPK